MSLYTVKYTTWKHRGFYEVVRWDSGEEGVGTAIVVQTNMLTREKAEHALKGWGEQEVIKHGE